MNRLIWRAAFAAMLFTTAVSRVCAQEEAATDAPYDITVEPDSHMANGRSAFLQGEADAQGQRFRLEGLDLDSPVSVSVFTQHRGEQVRVRLVKDNWDAPERDEQTDDRQRVDFKFRTFDSFRIWITAETPTPYQLVVWVGDKVALPLPSIAIPASQYVEGRSAAAATDAMPHPAAAAAATRGGGVSFSYLELALIATLLLVVIAFGSFVLMRRKPVQGA